MYGKGTNLTKKLNVIDANYIFLISDVLCSWKFANFAQ